MSWKQFISEIISSLAWPVIICIILIIFRIEIRKIVEQLTHIKYKDFEADFEKVKLKADYVHKHVANKDNTINNPIFASLEKQILDSIDLAPAASILLAWSSIESAIASAVSRLAISPEPPSYRSTKHNIEMLLKYSELSEKFAVILDEMRTLRNKIAHERNVMISITNKHAKIYSNIAIDIIQEIEQLKRKG